MFLRKTVARTTFCRLVPAAFRIPDRFCRTRSVCAPTSPDTRVLVTGSIETCPETKTNPLARIAWEYGPMARGPSLVEITSRMTAVLRCQFFVLSLLNEHSIVDCALRI